MSRATSISLASMLILSVGLSSGLAPIPASATAGPDTAAILAVPRPACDVTVTPETLEAPFPASPGTDPGITTTGTVSDLTPWVEALLPADPAALWGLTSYSQIRAIINLHPVLGSDPLAAGPVVATDAAGLASLNSDLFGPDAAAFSTSATEFFILNVVNSSADPRTGLTDTLDGLTTDGAWAFTSTANQETTNRILGDVWKVTYPVTLAPFIALLVEGDAGGTTATRAIIVPCTDRTAETPGVTETVAAIPAVACEPQEPVAGAALTCAVSGAPADFDFVWRAAASPMFSEGVVTTDADGRGSFSFTVPRDRVGSTLTVELVDWTGPLPFGTIAGPTPSSIPAGSGPSVRTNADDVLAAWGWLAAALLGAGLMRWGTARRRTSCA